MHEKSIAAFLELASKYNHNKSKNMSGSDCYADNPINSLDNTQLSLFRRTVQQKIKAKYEESRHLKTSPLSISKTVGFQPGLQNCKKVKKKIAIHTEEIDHHSVYPQQRELLSFSQMHKHDSLEKFINKKQHSFLKNSNLLVAPCSTSFKERKSINSQIKTEISHGVEGKKSKSISKHHDFSVKMRQQVANFGYEMDGSIYHFQGSNSYVEQQPSMKSSLRSHGQKTKDEVYEVLRNTSPLNIQRKLMKQKRTLDPNQTKEINIIHKLQKARQSYKLSNKRQKDDLKHAKLSKMVPSLLKQSNTLFLHSRGDDISGWEHEQDY